MATAIPLAELDVVCGLLVGVAFSWRTRSSCARLLPFCSVVACLARALVAPTFASSLYWAYLVLSLPCTVSLP